VNPPIAILGASARAAAASALRSGFQPITADLFADADLRAIATATRISPYPEGLLDWLRAVEPPAWMYTGAMENHPELIDEMAWLAPLWGNAGDVLARVRSPWELAAALRTAGLPFPETRPSAAGLPRDGTWLVKTYRGASGSGVRVWSGADGGGAIDEMLIGQSTHFPISASSHLVFQQCVSGAPCSAVFVAANGAAKLLGVTRQLIGETWLGAHGFQYAGSIGPLPIKESTLHTIKQIGDVLAKQFELTGLFGIDFILNGEEAWTVEVNPRYTASVEIIERATGVHAIARHADACCQLNVGVAAPPAPSSSLHGKAILFANRDLRVSESFAAQSLDAATETPWPSLADISPAGAVIETGRPVITVFAAGGTVAEVEQGLRNQVSRIERQLYAEAD
jgi:uncharacterized protein